VEKKIKNYFLITLSILVGFYLILIPLLIIYYDNGQVLSLLNNIHLIVLFSIVIFILILLINLFLIKSAKLVKLERIILLCIIGGNLILVFLLLFLFISPISAMIQDSSLMFAIIGIVYVIFSGLFIAIFASIKKSYKNKKIKN